MFPKHILICLGLFVFLIYSIFPLMNAVNSSLLSLLFFFVLFWCNIFFMQLVSFSVSFYFHTCVISYFKLVTFYFTILQSALSSLNAPISIILLMALSLLLFSSFLFSSTLSSLILPGVSCSIDSSDCLWPCHWLFMSSQLSAFSPSVFSHWNLYEPQCNALHCSALQCTTLQYSTDHFRISITQFSTVQCTTVCYSAI